MAPLSFRGQRQTVGMGHVRNTCVTPGAAGDQAAQHENKIRQFGQRVATATTGTWNATAVEFVQETHYS